MILFREIMCWVVLIYIIAFFARILLSWVPVPPGGLTATLGGFLYTITDPLLRPLRRIIPPLRLGAVGLDFIPAIVVTLLFIVRQIICP